MKDVGRHARRAALLSVVALVASLGVTFVAPTPAGATHYRANQLNWSTHGVNEAEFEATTAYRRSFWGAPNVGDTIAAPCIDFGDGSPTNCGSVVTFVDIANDVIITDKHVDHQYASAGPFTAFIADCCRLSGPEHINNPDGNTRAETVVNFAGNTANPVSSISPIVDCPLDAVCSFVVPASDVDGQTLRWRMATNLEAASGGSFDQPGPPDATNAATVNAATGLYQWDTTGATLNAGGQSFYSTQVMVEDLDALGNPLSKTPVDFFIRLTDSPNNQPVFVAPTPADGTVIAATTGSPVTFDVAASDPDAADTVTLSILGLPVGSTFAPTAGNPATGTFTWTPPADGDTILTLIAADQNGLQAVQRSVTIRAGGGGPTLPLVSIDDVDVIEGTGGTRKATFTVSLSAPAVPPASVDFETGDGTALAPADYGDEAGTLVFRRGTTSRQVTVTIVSDAVDEPDETFEVHLDNAVGLTIDDGHGEGTIIDDDRDGIFICRSSTLRLNTLETAVANPPSTPCVDDVETLEIGPLNLGLLSVTSNTLSAVTRVQPDDLRQLPAAKDGAEARARVERVDIVLLGQTITLGVVTSETRVTCVPNAAHTGLEPVFAAKSRVALLEINGAPIDIGTGPISIGVPGLAAIHLNLTTTAPGAVTQQAAFVDTILGDVVISETTVAIAGNPCTGEPPAPAP